MLDHLAKRERDARAYCRSIGLDPDEVVWGCVNSHYASRVWGQRVRWWFYQGAGA